MLGLLATDMRYTEHEIGLDMATSAFMITMTNLQLTDSTLGTVTVVTATIRIFLLNMDSHVIYSI